MDVWEFRGRENSGVDDETEILAQTVIGTAIEVHRILGPGLSEVHYQKALCRELTIRSVQFSCEREIDIHYKEACIGTSRLDLIVADRLIVELKAVDSLSPVHRSQVITYLRITNLKLALLINFNVPILKDGIKRIINTM